MISLIRKFKHYLAQFSFSSKQIVSNTSSQINKRSYNLIEDIADENFDIIIATSENSIIPAMTLAQEKNCPYVIDLQHLPSNKNLNDQQFNQAINDSNLIFSASRDLATLLEKKIKRHISISRHVSKIVVQNKYIDLKKLLHLIEDTRVIIFDGYSDHATANDVTKPLKYNLIFLASLLQKLPRFVHIVVTGGIDEQKIFDQLNDTFAKYECQSRLHFHIENTSSIKYPLDYGKVDLALLLGEQPLYTPSQYYKYLHEQVPIFATNFADANQLITAAAIGQVFDNKNLTQWVKSIISMLNLSTFEIQDIVKNLYAQKLNINWHKESEHFTNSLINLLELDENHMVNACIIDLSKNDISNRSHNMSHMLIEKGFKLSVLTPFLPKFHTPLANGVNYIRLS